MSSIATDEDIVEKWIEIDDSIDVPKQTLDEILAEKPYNFEEDVSVFEDDISSMVTILRDTRPVSPACYELDQPIIKDKLESISYQLRVQFDRNSGGSASAIAVSIRHIAVGTTRGFLLIFNRENERLEYSHASEVCSISCLHFSLDGLKLAIGYSAGLIKILAVNNRKMLENTDDIVQPGRGILQLHFIGSGRRLLIIDNGGSVYELRLAIGVRSRRISCIFSGSNGEVVYVNSLSNDHVIVFLSLKKVFLINLPDARIIHIISLHGPANRPPLFDKQIIDTKLTSAKGVKGEAFCIGRGRRLDLFRLVNAIDGTKSIIPFRPIHLNFEMINFKWIDSARFLILSPDEKIHLIDIELGEMGVLNISDIGLVYASADFKGASTGGNVSSALKCISDSVCYQSVYHFNNQLYIAGQSSIYCISVMEELTQLELFIQRNDITSAILYATDLLTGKLINRSRRTDFSSIASSVFPDLIDQLLFLTTDGLSNGKVICLIDHYKKYVSLLMKTCITTGNIHLLYNKVYPCLEKDPLSKVILFENLDEFISDGLLSNPPADLISDYLQYLVSEGHLNQFEGVVVRLPIDRLNIHFVMTTCHANNLFNGIISVCNRAFSDFIGPLEEMFETMEKFIDSDVLSDCEIALGNKLLLYLQCCLSGKAYPHGLLPKNISKSLPIDVYKCLVSFKGKDGSSVTKKYPYINMLIQFDAPQFFNIIYTCSSIELFNEFDDRLLKLVEIIYEIINSLKTNRTLIAHFLTFINRLVEIKAFVPPNNIVSELIQTALSFDSSFQSSDVLPDLDENVVKAMQSVHGLDEGLILDLAHRAQNTLVQTHIFMNRREFDKLIDCYIADSNRAENVFLTIENLMKELQGKEKNDFTSYIRSSLLRLAEVDAYRCALLVLNYFSEWLNEMFIVDNCFSYLLYSCFVIRQEQNLRSLTMNEELDEKLLIIASNGIIRNCKHKNAEQILVKLFRFWISTASRSDACLNLAVTHKIFWITFMLLEARKLIDRAAELLFDELDKRLEDKSISSARTR